MSFGCFGHWSSWIALSSFAIPVWMREGRLPTGQFGPYMYPFVKSKPFPAAGGHICDKPSHICLRKVVSFRKAAPSMEDGRSRNSNSHRHCRGGLFVWQLKKMMPQFRRNLAALRAPSHPHHCVVSGGNKWHATLLVSDAAQMYEQVESSLGLQAFDAKVDLLQPKKLQSLWIKAAQSEDGREAQTTHVHLPKGSFCLKAKTKASGKLPFAFCKYRQFTCTSKGLGHRRLAIHDCRYLLINPRRKAISPGGHTSTFPAPLTIGQSEMVVWNEVCRRPTTGFASCACVIAVCENVY